MQQPVEGRRSTSTSRSCTRVAAIDVAKASGMVCLRTPHQTGRADG